ncbi:hypothetical protein D9M70_597700 [compost metagenome]
MTVTAVVAFDAKDEDASENDMTAAAMRNAHRFMPKSPMGPCRLDRLAGLCPRRKYNHWFHFVKQVATIRSAPERQRSGSLLSSF